MFIFLTILLVLSMASSKLEMLPFLNGKFIYWLPLIIVGGMYFIIKKSIDKYSINLYDIVVIILFILGLWNFAYVSNAGIFNLKIWYMTGYLLLYVVLRNLLNTKDLIFRSLNFLLYFISATAVSNALIAILQNNNVLTSANEYFKTTGLFYSPNQLGLITVLGIITTIEIIKKQNNLKSKFLLSLPVLLLIYVLYLSQCRGAFLALCITLTLGFYFANLKKVSLRAIALSGLMACLLFLLIIGNTNSTKSESLSGRVLITKLSLEKIKDNPLLGHGIDSFSLQYNLAKAHYFEQERTWDEIKNAAYVYNVNNDFIELAFEFGLLWCFIFILFAFMLYFLSKNKETNTAGSILLCLSVFCLTNTILPVPAFVILGCIYAVIIINTSELKPICVFKNFSFFKISINVFIASFLAVIILRMNAEYELLKLYNGTTAFSDIKSIESYISKIDANGEQFFMAGGILLKNNYINLGTDYLAAGFQQSGKPDLGKILAGVYKKQGRYNEAEKIYKYNINVEPYRFDARMDLFNLYVQTNQKLKAKEAAKEIINLPIKISSEKINNYKKEAKFYLDNSDI